MAVAGNLNLKDQVVYTYVEVWQRVYVQCPDCNLLFGIYLDL